MTSRRSLASTWLPGETTISLTAPASPACRTVSIFMASSVSTTSPFSTLWPGVTAIDETTRHGSGDVAKLSLIGLPPGADRRRYRAVRNPDHPRLAVELEEDADLSFLIGLADGLQPYDQGFAALERNGRLLTGLEAVEIN